MTQICLLTGSIKILKRFVELMDALLSLHCCQNSISRRKMNFLSPFLNVIVSSATSKSLFASEKKKEKKCSSGLRKIEIEIGSCQLLFL